MYRTLQAYHAPVVGPAIREQMRSHVRRACDAAWPMVPLSGAHTERRVADGVMVRISITHAEVKDVYWPADPMREYKTAMEDYGRGNGGC
jgi:hypothetical protein